MPGLNHNLAAEAEISPLFQQTVDATGRRDLNHKLAESPVFNHKVAACTGGQMLVACMAGPSTTLKFRHLSSRGLEEGLVDQP